MILAACVFIAALVFVCSGVIALTLLAGSTGVPVRVFRASFEVLAYTLVGCIGMASVLATAALWGLL